MSDDDSNYSEPELQLAIADSLTWLKRKRDITHDEELAFKLQLEEQGEYHHSATITPRIQSAEKHWTCSQCTFLNSCNSSLCEMCEAPIQKTRPIVDRKPTTLITNNFSTAIDHEYYVQLEEIEELWNATEESLTAASKTWTCLTCLNVNAINATECPQCREPKSATTAVQEELKSWSCSKCTFDNSYNDTDCFMCGNPIPSHLRSHLNHKRPSECGLPGCCQHASHYGFCSHDHFDRALKRNIIPPCEYGVEAVFVGHTGDYTAHLLRSSHEKHASVKKQFLDSWKKGDGLPRVERIYWIRMKPEILDTFEQTKRKIGSNVQRLFHGTSQSSNCFFGTNQSKPPCVDNSCRVCSIIRTSFDLIHVKRGEGGRAWAHQTQQLRYGEGMYFSPVSSKSNDYNRLSEREMGDRQGHSRKWKCMFLCNVVLGRSYKTKEGFLPPNKCPPPSYDSVWGETSCPSDPTLPHLNYDEACVYNANQAIPSYFIVYSLA